MQSITTWTFKPDEPLKLARRFSDQEGTAFFYSGGNLSSARRSYLCLFPYKKIILPGDSSCWNKLKEELGNFDSHALPIPKWVGYLGYEMGCFSEPDYPIPCLRSKLPACLFYAPSVVIAFEHATSQATLFSNDPAYCLEDGSTQPLPKNITFRLSYASDDLASYSKKIKQAKEWIVDGEFYQINLSHELHFAGKASPFVLFEKTVDFNPAPFSAYIRCVDFAIVSSSPERFLCKRGRKLETRPIKGTAPRGATKKEDHEKKRDLLSSEKERAELMMITDLMRNDLGKICLPATVHTPHLGLCEAYTNVFHLLSIIEGEISPQIHPLDSVKALFPGGSITGCPKLRAMEAIHRLEQRARGIYTGSIGYFAENGDFDFNIAIRTLIVHPEFIQLQLGGAIGSDSNPVDEFNETLHKGRTLFKILGIKEAINDLLLL
jgi:para-aminobenzoate synthetase component 1